MPKIVLAPNSFKGSLKAELVAVAMEKGVKAFLPEANILKIPLSDGGDGLLDALLSYKGGLSKNVLVTGPWGKKINSSYGIINEGKTAVIEMAKASGMAFLADDNINPMETTSYGTGELIKDALDYGCEELIIGLGGSATNDGGMGLAQALGARFYDLDGNLLGFGGKELIRIASIDLSFLDNRLFKKHIKVACDVDNPMTGDRGSTRIYGPQKGAKGESLEALEAGMKNYAAVLNNLLNLDVENLKGSGAAGGTGGGIHALLGGDLISGIELVMDLVKLSERVSGSDLIITGEGKLDGQTVFGKVPFGVASLAREKKIPVIALAGTVADDAKVLHEHGVLALFSILDSPMDLSEAFAKTEILLEKVTEEIVRLYFSHLGSTDRSC